MAGERVRELIKARNLDRRHVEVIDRYFILGDESRYLSDEQIARIRGGLEGEKLMAFDLTLSEGLHHGVLHEKKAKESGRPLFGVKPEWIAHIKAYLAVKKK